MKVNNSMEKNGLAGLFNIFVFYRREKIIQVSNRMTMSKC